MTTEYKVAEHGRILVPFDTAIGPSVAKLSGAMAEHVFVSPADGCWTHRGHKYTGQLFLKRLDFSPAFSYSGDVKTGKGGPVSNVAYTAIHKAIIPALIEYVAANPRVLEEAERAWAADQAIELAGKIAAAEVALSELKDKHAAMLAASKQWQHKRGDEQ